MFKLYHQTVNLGTCWPYVQIFEIKMDRQLQGCNVLSCAQDIKQRQSRAGITAHLIHLLECRDKPSTWRSLLRAD